MEKISISKNFTVEDIHKIRENNYEKTKLMTKGERNNYYKQREQHAIQVQRQIDAMRVNSTK